MKYRIVLSALAIITSLAGVSLNALSAGEQNRTEITALADKFYAKGTEAIRGAMSPQKKLDEAVRLKVEESYGKLPLSFIRNDGQLNKQVQYYEKGAGHATYFTKQGVYLSLPERSGQKAGAGEMGYGPRITENGIQSNPKPLDLFLISYREPLSQIQNQQTTANIRTNNPGSNRTGIGFVRATPVNDLKPQIQNPKSEIVRLLPLGIEKDVEIVAGKEQAGKVNYLIGNDPKKWQKNIPMYESVVYKGVYDGIDMKFYGNNRQMEYDIIVSPGASPSRVQLSYEGIEGLTVAENGDLEISLKEGKLIQKKPYVYQEIDGKRVEIDGKFRIQKNAVIARNTATKQSPAHEDKIASPGHALRSSAEARNDSNTKLGTPRSKRFIYGFQVASYDKRYPLVIDPVLVYSTYLGGSSVDYGYAIAVDAAGHAYVTGITQSPDFPTVSPLEGTLNGVGDIFITKLYASGDAIVYSTYVGGSDYEQPMDIAIDDAEHIYVTGWTTSSDFPVLRTLFTSLSGGSDAFVFKLDQDGMEFHYSTYLGGSSPFAESGTGIGVDALGYAHVTGYTHSYDFPVTNGGSLSGGADAFVTKFSPWSAYLYYSHYLGGSGEDFGYSIAVDTLGYVFVTGITTSSDFPLASPVFVYDETYNGGGYDAFVTHLDNDGRFEYSTYLGGNGGDYGNDIAIDSTGYAYVTGDTSSTDFPMVSPYDGSLGGNTDAFITKLNVSGSALVYSTYLGGSDADEGSDIAVDAAGCAYVTGHSSSLFNFPITIPPWGGHDFPYTVGPFITKLSASGSSLVYSTCFSSYATYASGIAVDTVGNAYITGQTIDQEFPTVSPYDGSLDGGYDAFVCKIGSGTTVPVLKAHYTFDEMYGSIAGDSSGNGNAGSIYGPTWTSGKSLGGLNFDGVNDYVTIPRMNNDEVSVSAWFYKNANDTTRNDAIFSGFRYNSNVQLSEGFELRFPSGNPKTLQFILVTQDSSGIRTRLTAGRNLRNSVGSWYHAVGTYDRTTGKQRLYVNGELVSTVTHPAGNTVVPLMAYTDMRIGYSRINNGYFNGVIDDVRLYTYPLNYQQIHTLYTAYTGDLQAYYTLNEGSGTIANDTSGNGNHGTVNGGATWTVGINGNGLGFDGVDDYVSIPRINHDEMSVTAWFYKNANDTTRNDAVFSGFRYNANVQLSEGFELRFPSSNPKLLQFMLVTQDSNGIRTRRTAGKTLQYPEGVWYHAAGTYNKTTGKQRLYVNGELVSTITHPAGNTVVPLTFYPDMRIGHSWLNSGYFTGVIDNIRLYKLELTAPDVLSLYNNGL